jgi:DNA repair exonuclease SbcCD nuclease subunit
MLYGKTHIYYTGSPIQLDWGEKNEEKRFLIVDSETLEVESIPTTGYKKYLEFDVNENNKTEILEQAKELRDKGHHVKLVTTEKLDFGEDMKSINVVENVEEDITNRGITSSMNEKDKNLKYMEIKGIPEEERDAYLKTAMRIIDKTELPE